MKTFIFSFLFVSQVFANPFNLNTNQDFSTWLQSESYLSESKLLQAMTRTDIAAGAVIASPSRQKPDYFYHWVRDAALSMDVVVELYTRTQNAEYKQHLEQKIHDYILFSLSNQQRPDALTGLGEPKFYVDGRPYDLNWGRPQNDGPALRALTLIKYAKIKLAQDQNNLVRTSLYDAQYPTQSLIKADLEYVASHWQDKSFDLWEEILGEHFFTLSVQKASLEQGAALAQALGDFGASDWYLKQAQQIAAKLQNYYNSPKSYILTTLNGGATEKKSNLDTAVLLAFLRSNNQHLDYDWSQPKILGTVQALVDGFSRLYPINVQFKSPGVAIGRYTEDVYDGDSFQGGNPWVLTTLAVAETYYELSRWTALHTANKDLALNYFNTGDEFFKRVQLHANPDGSLSEQISRFNGYMTSAVDLTWNYAAILTTAWARERAQAAQ